MIKVKRVYDRPEPVDGARFLVERLWARGVKKEALRLDDWLKEAAPSDTLRRWFGHDPAKWAEFQRRYVGELDRKPEAWRPIARAARRGNVTLLYSAQDTAHNNAVGAEGVRGESAGDDPRPLEAMTLEGRPQAWTLWTLRTT